MNRPKSYLLTSPVCVAAVALLLLNDFALKPSYPCWMTGKLSDFTGLFSFCVLALIIGHTAEFCSALLYRLRFGNRRFRSR
jgi:hypothetical protein